MSHPACACKGRCTISTLKKKTFFVEPPRSSTLAHVGDDIRVPPVCPQGPWFKALALPVHFSVRFPLGFYIIGVL